MKRYENTRKVLMHIVLRPLTTLRETCTCIQFYEKIRTFVNTLSLLLKIISKSMADKLAGSS